jgi:hypothetical protein
MIERETVVAALGAKVDDASAGKGASPPGRSELAQPFMRRSWPLL